MTIRPFTMAPAADREAAQASANAEAWTGQATEALQSVSLATTPTGVQGIARGTSVKLPTPLNANSKSGQDTLNSNDRVYGTTPSQGQVHIAYGKRSLVRRDSLDRCEALLKGKEGSRQRRRWENDRLLSNPWATPPLPSDWEVQPTYTRQVVPYYLAPLWDAAEFQRSIEAKMHGRDHGKHRKNMAKTAKPSQAEEAASNVPKEVRAKLKRARAAKGLLMDLEEEVRLFLKMWGERRGVLEEKGLGDVDVDDSEEEEIVFVGRNGVMHDEPDPGQKGLEKEGGEVAKQKLVFEGLVEDKGASFGRWLVHSIATYYGLRTWSITVGDPARREAYVGLVDRKSTFAIESKIDLPRPLHGMV